MDLQGWDDRYRGAALPNATPTPLLAKITSQLRPGKALDLACGSGRNALWLAERGWDVTAVDGSAVGIELLREAAAQRGVSLDARQADLEKHEFEIGASQWDFIAICYYLQRDMFEPAKRGLKPGGVALVIVHLAELGRDESRFNMQPRELASYFDGWEILHAHEGRPNDSEHRHAVAEIAVRRAASPS